MAYKSLCAVHFLMRALVALALALAVSGCIQASIAADEPTGISSETTPPADPSTTSSPSRPPGATVAPKPGTAQNETQTGPSNATGNQSAPALPPGPKPSWGNPATA